MTPRIFLIIAITCCGFTAYTGSRVLITLFALEQGVTALGVGALVALYGLGPMLLSVFAGQLCDRAGVRRPIVYGSIGTVAGLSLPALVAHPAILYVSALSAGLSFVFFSVAVQNLVPALPGKGQRIANAEQRTRNVSNFSLGISVAQFVGPLISGFGADHLGHRIAYAVLAACAIVPAIAFSMRRGLVPPRTRKAVDDYEKGSMIDLLRMPGLRRTFITSGVIMAGVDLFVFYTPVFGRSIHLSASAIGVVLAIYAAAQFIVRFFMPLLVRRLGEDGLLNVTLFLAAATFLAFPFFQSPVVLSVIAFVLGLGLGCGQPLSLMMTYNRAPQGRSGEALGIRFTVINLVHMVVPLMFGSLSAALGVVPVYWGNALFLALGGLVNIRSNRRRKAR